MFNVRSPLMNKTNPTTTHSRRIGICNYLLFIILFCINANANAEPSSQQHGVNNKQQKWVSTFSSPPQRNAIFRPPLTIPPLNFQTVRNVVHISLGGEKIRVRLSNTYGDGPLLIDAASVGLFDDNTNHKSNIQTLTFDGESSIMIPVGSDIYSDPVSLNVASDSDVAISIFVSGDSGAPTIEDVTNKTSYVITGDHTQSAQLPNTAEAIDYGYFIRGIDVQARKKATVVASFGSSVLDGFNSGLDQNNSFSNFLSRRLHQKRRYENVSVINACVSGNRLLDETSVFGRAGLSRIDDDVISHSGVEHMVLLLGRNDIGFPQIADILPPGDRALAVTSAQIIAGLKQLLTKAHANNIKVYIGTYLPYKGSILYTDEGNEIRIEVNQWLRSTDLFDAVIDFDEVMRDPNDPTQLRPEFNSGDGTHPNAAGYEAMANAVDLKLFK